MLTYAIPCLFGLEGLVGDGLRRLGLQDVQVGNGRAVCRARKPDCPHCVLRPWCDHFQNTQEG